MCWIWLPGGYSRPTVFETILKAGRADSETTCVLSQCILCHSALSPPGSYTVRSKIRFRILFLTNFWRQMKAIWICAFEYTWYVICTEIKYQ